MASLDTTQLIAIAAALGWASGLRLYLVLTIVGLAGYTGWIELPAGLKLLQHPLVLGACSLMLFIEFFADKIPGLDTLWDLVHTVIRIPAGAALAAAVFGVDDAVITLVAALLGGTLAATAHSAKATTRAAVNTSPEPFSNIGVSLLEDGLVPLALWLAYAHPFIFLTALAIALVLMLVLIVALSKFFVSLWRRLRGGSPVPIPQGRS
jgi:hypothetical protein